MSVARHKGSAPSAGALLASGPLVRMIVSPGGPLAAAMRARGLDVPSETVHMMVDTGADGTMLHVDVATRLGLIPTGWLMLGGVNPGQRRSPVFPMTLQLATATDSGHLFNVTFGTDVVGIAAPPKPGTHGLLGRDFLSHVRFVYDGPEHRWEIADHRAPPAPSGRPGSKARRKGRKSR